MHWVEPLFNYQSVAVVGATERSGYGSRTFEALRDMQSPVRYYPVNPRYEQVHGVRAYPDLRSLPEVPDMVFIAIARDRVVPTLRTCVELGVKAAVTVAAGFVEDGTEHGRALQAELVAVAREHRLPVIGPNCFGVASVVYRTAAFAGGGLAESRPGNVAVISNSGGMIMEIISYGNARGIGFSHLASTGNEAVVTAADLLDYFVDDPHTDVILAILETVRDPALFVAAAERAVAARKPIVVLKMGASPKGAVSAMTHTGALAGSDAVYSAVFRQKGIIRVDDMDDLIEMGAALAPAVPLLRRRPLERAAVIEISGGGKELLCDTAYAAGVELPDPTPEVVAALTPHLAPGGVVSNPLDTTGNWNSPWIDALYPAALEAFATQPDIDLIVSRFGIPRTGPLGFMEKRLAELLAARERHPDTLFPILTRTSDQFTDEWTRRIAQHDLCFLLGYGRGMRALGRLAAYSRYLRSRPPAEGPRAPRVAPRLLDPALADRAALNEVEAKDLLRAAGLPVVPTGWARTADEAVALAEQYGYPCAAKVLSPQIVHKSDVGGVRLGLADAAAVRQAFAELQAVAARVPGAEFHGVAVQPLAPPGLELALGAHRDPQFGPVVLFGLGGIFIEALHDVALRVAPLSEFDARSMLDEVQARALLDGVRGRPGVNRAALVDALCRLGDLLLAEPRIASLDLNPVLAYPDGLLAVDARVALG